MVPAAWLDLCLANMKIQKVAAISGYCNAHWTNLYWISQLLVTNDTTWWGSYETYTDFNIRATVCWFLLLSQYVYRCLIAFRDWGYISWLQHMSSTGCWISVSNSHLLTHSDRTTYEHIIRLIRLCSSVMTISYLGWDLRSYSCWRKFRWLVTIAAIKVATVSKIIRCLVQLTVISFKSFSNLATKHNVLCLPCLLINYKKKYQFFIQREELFFVLISACILHIQ